MWEELKEKKRLLLLIGLGAVLVVVCLVVYLAGGSSSREPGGGDAANDGGNSRGIPEAGHEKTPQQVAAAARYREVAHIALAPKPEDLPQLKKAATDPDWKVRYAGVEGVGKLRQDGDPKFLIETLRNTKEKPEVRAVAAQQLGEMRYWDAGPDLINAMEDPSELLRARAGVALRRIMVVDFDYRANDPHRDVAVRRLRQMWPWFYEKFANDPRVKR